MITDCDPDFTGMQIDRYLLSSCVGAGASGTVYRAMNITLDNSLTLAIKCVRQRSHPRHKRAQIAEIRNHGTVVGCVNVLKLYDVFECDGFFFFVMPLCKSDMHKAIWKRNIYWKNDALIKEAFVDVLDGVLACHKKGIFHRDLKPENILCDLNGTNIQISDFGLSTHRRLCNDGPCGTAAYLGPECWNERGAYYHSDLADIWALGIVLFNLVTCRFPWDVSQFTNKDFQAFLSEDNYLLRTYPISKPLNTLLRQILHPNSLRRASIVEIRRAVVLMETFYKPDLPPVKSRSPLANELLLIDSQQTCVVTADEAKNHRVLDRSVINTLEECHARATLEFWPAL